MSRIVLLPSSARDNGLAIWSWLGILLSPANAGMKKVFVPLRVLALSIITSTAAQQEQVVKSVAKCVWL